MAYPATIDMFTGQSDYKDRIYAQHINEIHEAIGNIETELGTDPAGSLTDLKTRLAVILNNDGTLKGYGQNLVVAKSGSAYSSLASAVAAITDASASKPYSILVMPGIYETSMAVLPDYVSLIGIDPHSCILKSTTANTTYVIQTGNNSCIMNLGITNNGAVNIVAGREWCIYVQDDTARIENCILTNTGSGGAVASAGGWLGIYGTSTVQIWNTQMLMASTAFGTNIGIMQTGAAATKVYLYHCDLRITSGPASATGTYCVDMGDGEVYIYNSTLYSVAIVVEVITTAKAQVENSTLVTTANNAIPIHAETSDVTLYNCTILKHGSATVCIYTDVANNIRVAHCRMNLASPIHADLTNLIETPYNVMDTDV